MTDISFHEATIRDIQTDNRVTTITLDDGIVKSVKCSAQIVLRDLTNIQRDGKPIDSLQLEKEDGEVLTLTETPLGMELIVEWNKFSQHMNKTIAYKILCRDFVVLQCL